ncbi:hypothetical protein JTB14_026292 [Gonioctena quinquepunctata]|nr:hypothetical protein JTB14_026292 [Gonioctena quinquepunctata]
MDSTKASPSNLLKRKISEIKFINPKKLTEPELLALSEGFSDELCGDSENHSIPDDSESEDDSTYNDDGDTVLPNPTQIPAAKYVPGHMTLNPWRISIFQNIVNYCRQLLVTVNQLIIFSDSL